jgi:protein-tyrosine phosphatase
MLNKATEDVHRSLECGDVILNCQSRVYSASSSVCIAYLMRYRCFNYEKAFYDVKGLKCSINPSLAFKKHLLAYQMELTKQCILKSKLKIQLD